MRAILVGVVAAAGITAGIPKGAGQVADSGQPAIVSHVKVVSDRVEDVSSIEAWKRSFIKPGMTDKQKALAVWETVVKFRHQDNPPHEYLANEDCVHDPIKTFNVYGYGMCCCASSNIEALARAAGLQARGRILNAHSVPEVFWDGAWHMLDASLLNYFPKPDGRLASVDEISESAMAWFAQHPDLRKNGDALTKYQQQSGWKGWKSGPALLSDCPFYDENGWWPAATHGWFSTMQEYDVSPAANYEYGYSQGYEVNIQLRPGERLTRNWSNKGLHVDSAEGGSVGCLTHKVGEGDLRYAVKHGDLAPGRIGNGVHEYDVPLATGGFRGSALQTTNLACRSEDGHGPAVHVKAASQPGVLELDMPSSYVYLGGAASFSAVVGSGGEIRVLLSDNNGLDWKLIGGATSTGPVKIDLKPLIYRRYDYRTRFAMTGAGTGLDSLRFTHDVQHSQRALPALGQGDNRITFSAGPQEGTVTLEGSTNPSVKGKQLVWTDFHPVRKGVQDQFVRIPDSGTGSATFPIETPGDMTRIRLGAHYRCRDARDVWDVSVSFDEGKTFRPVDRFAGPTGIGSCKYVTHSDIPPGTRKALIRWSGSQVNTTCLLAMRMDADYRQPCGGFRPVKVTYVWEEGGVEKRDVHVAARPDETYHIRCESAPLMKSISLELAP